MTQDLVPWIKHNFATTGAEQNWLIGFSKSGYGAQDLILRHPGMFTSAASWDFPADMSSCKHSGHSPMPNLTPSAIRQKTPGQRL